MATAAETKEDSSELKQVLEAASRGDVSELDKLLDAGAEVNATDKDGWSPLILASKLMLKVTYTFLGQNGHLDAVQQMLKRGAKPNPSVVAHSALRGASIYGQDHVIRVLLAAQGDPNIPSFHDRTPLMGAAMNGHVSTAAILLAAGARHDAVNDEGETALDVCKTKGNNEVAKVIVNGAARQALKSGRWAEAEQRLKLSDTLEDVINIEFEGVTLLDVAAAAANEEATAALIAMGATKGGGGNTAGVEYAAVSLPRLPPLHENHIAADREPPSSERAMPAPTGAADAEDQQPARRRALVIGGTQFMGRLTVQALDDAGWEVMIITRGKSKNPHPPRVKHIACNRNTEREQFRTIVQDHGPWQVVVDFVAFYKESVMDVALALGTAPTHYILISTDSVYMACQLPAAEDRPEGVSEEHSRRPESDDDKELLRRRDKYQYGYGSNKLECEECLSALRQRTGFRFTALRLSDVVGPFDNLGVFLRILALVTKGLPVPVGPRKSDGVMLEEPQAPGRMSLVSAKDVAAAVLATIDAGPRVHGEAINIAGDDTPTLEEFVSIIAHAQGGCEPSFDAEKQAMLPSVSFGPISVTKAKQKLAWTPTAITEWVNETVQWYQDGKNVAYTASYALMPSA